ncbi:hypothetical protein ACHAXM_003157 [Skeletonema potamos]|jgi:serine/threonine-protein kinase RIO1
MDRESSLNEIVDINKCQESSPKKSDTDDAPPASKQTGSVWGIPAPATLGNSNEQRSRATLADIMTEQESEKINPMNIKNAKVKFSYDVESEEERMMRLAIEASLRYQQHVETEATKQPVSVLKKSHVSLSSNTATKDDDDDMDEDIKLAIALSLASSGGNASIEVDESIDDDSKPSALVNSEVTDNIDERKPPAADNKDVHDEDASEKLARALHEAEMEEYNSSQTAQEAAAAEAASLALALQLQREEDSRHLNNVTIENANRAAQLKREAMCRGHSVGRTGIRTVDRDEFQIMQNLKGCGGDGIVYRRRDEERGMGKLLHTHYPEDASGEAGGEHPSNGVDSYYYYANDRLQADEVDGGDYEEDCFGIKMNSQSASSRWQRVDKDTFIGPNNEIKSKHDPELKHKSNAMNLLDGNDVESSAVSDRAYNAFRRSEARQSGMKKGVLNHGTGRAENMQAAKTRGGAMDGNVRLQIAAAVNLGLIERCNGVVKEGKEGLVYHAESGWKGKKSRDNSTQEMDSDGFDVAVKVFKRIAEFRNRRDYVDGDPRYVKQKFKTNDAREQVVLWTEKEYRNLLRAWRGGISVPAPLYQKENILFMRFLGDDGWPSPQLREIDLKKGSHRWTTLYCQTLVAVRRLYHCARLIHGDLSEYNILVCPQWQVKKGPLLSLGERSDDDEDLQVVLIDFGQAVDRGHPAANEFLRRDLSTVTQFFANRGITTLSASNAEEFVVHTSCSDAGELGFTDHDYDEEGGSKKTINWRNIAAGWDEKGDMESLLARLASSKALSSQLS